MGRDHRFLLVFNLACQGDVEDCVSRCPSHLPEPTEEELTLEKDWEADPPPHLYLEKLAKESTKLKIQPERICQVEESQICLNIMFKLNEVRES